MIGSVPMMGFLFDLDGVLVDSEKQYTRIWESINSEFPTGVDDMPQRIKGTTLDKILSEYYPDAEVRKKVTARLYELEAKMVYAMTPGANELLEKLANRMVGVALVTSSDSHKMKHLWKDLKGLKKCFNVIIDATQVTRSKPDPQGYLLAARSLNADPEACVVFEDSLQGVKAGKAAGCYVVGVAGTLKREVIEPYCDRVVDSLEEIDPDEIISRLITRTSEHDF